jgi:uncharacterized protein (DUF488 family)
MSQTELLTIGYEGSSIVDFLATIKQARVDIIIDVRDVPISRKAGFSKNALSAGLADQQIDYLHLKGLGDPKPGRVAAREGRYDDFRDIFNTHLLTHSAKIDMQRGVEASAGRKACLLCFERDHLRCHRHIIADEFMRRGDFRLTHIGVREGPGLGPRPKGFRHHDSFSCTVG